jgi:uncharacterized membrane protein
MKGTRLTTILAIVAIAIGVAIAAGPGLRPRCTPLTGDVVVTARVDGLKPGTARFYCYRDPTGQKIRFVLARALDGSLHSAFDACQQCFRFHKGYTIAQGFLICRLCGNRYKLDQMQTGVASCRPVHLKTVRHGDTVKVEVAALEKERKLF